MKLLTKEAENGLPRLGEAGDDRVFNRIRTLDEIEAAEVINIFVQHGDNEVRKELDTFIIFMAEFRSSSFKDWPKSRGIVPPYDPKPIQAMLKDFLENGLR